MMTGMYLGRKRAFGILSLAVPLTAAACGSPAAPTAPPAQLILSCPPPQTAVSFQGQPATVSWPAPTAQGGTPPIQTTCTPASGSAFTVGAATVGCTATGSGPNQTANCTFTVTVTRAPQLSVSRFMAFGDSITHGTKSDPASFLAFPLPPPSYSYPSQLQLILGSRYTDQTVTMGNEGWPGEMIDDGLRRLPSALSANTPDVVLLLDGANDLLNSPSSATTQYIATKLRDMIRTSKAQVAANRVLLATFPPQFVGTPPNRGAGWSFVPELNGRIASVATSEGAILVDLYTPMNADVKRYIGQDGLHPTEQGFTLMAQTFAKIIQEKFEAKTGAR
jgi:lysophospholipase L1-like esterase